MKAQLYHLESMTTARLSLARQQAREGQKDPARDWYRFFEQSQILKLLEATGRDVSALRNEMNLLRDECHPAQENSNKGELQRIADALEILTDYIMDKPRVHDERQLSWAFRN